MTRKLKEQKAIKTKEKATVVDRMLKVCERDTAVAVSDATLELAGELKKTKRAGEGLKHKLGRKCEALASYYVLHAVPNICYLLLPSLG